MEQASQPHPVTPYEYKWPYSNSVISKGMVKEVAD